MNKTTNSRYTMEPWKNMLSSFNANPSSSDDADSCELSETSTFSDGSTGFLVVSEIGVGS
jgi:hypothetical protein